MDDAIKICSTCSESKLLTDYHKHSNYIDGLNKECKACRCKSEKQRRYRIRQETGLSFSAYNRQKYGEEWYKEKARKNEEYQNKTGKKKIYGQKRNAKRTVKKAHERELKKEYQCAKCGITCEYKGSSKKERICTACFNANRTAYKKSDSFKMAKKRWKEKNKARLLKMNKERYINNKERILNISAKSKAKAIDGISDAYICKQIRQLTGLSAKEIRANPDMIEAKRQLLKLKRAIQNYDKEQQGRS